MTHPRPVDNLIHILRECSHVERMHTTPHHGSYTVGQHSFDMLTLLFALYPGGEPSLNLIKAVIYHDFPSRWTGDVPEPAQESDGNFAKRLAMAEQRIMQTLGGNFELDEIERVWLKALHKLELYFWACDQMRMGNANLQPLMVELNEFFRTIPTPTPILALLSGHTWTRTSDHFPRSAT